MNQLTEIQIENKEDFGLIVSSRVVAEEIGREHSKVIRGLEQLLAEPNVASLIFENEYRDKQNKPRKEYLFTKDGFTLYMFNIQVIAEIYKDMGMFMRVNYLFDLAKTIEEDRS